MSLNGPRRPDLRAKILDGSFQRYRCAACGQGFRVEDPFVYLDFERKHWISVFAPAREAEWALLEGEPHEDWKQAMVTHAPPVARGLSAGFRIRAVFGLDALREKLLCFDHGLDDVWLSVLALDVLRTSPEGFRPDRRPRLYAVDDDSLWMGITGTPTRLRVARELLRRTMADPLEHAATYERLSRGPYVDVGRLMTTGQGTATF